MEVASLVPSRDRRSENRTLLETVKYETQINASFRFAIIGASLAIIGAIMTIIINVYTRKVCMTTGILLVNFIVMTVMMALAVYTNYCVVNGNCTILAKVQAFFLMLAGILSILLSLLNLFFTRNTRQQVNSVTPRKVVSPRNS